MRKAYSKRAGAEVFALAPEQIDIFKGAGYDTPTAEEAIADAGAIKLIPPEGKRAYVVFDFAKGEFFLRVRTCTLKSSELAGFVSELVQAAITKRAVESADPDRPKAEPTSAATASPLGTLITETLKKSLLGGLTASAVASHPAAGGDSRAVNFNPAATSGEEVSE